MSAASTGLPSARASLQVSSSAAATSVPADSAGSPGAKDDDRSELTDETDIDKEEHDLRDEIENFPKDGDLSNLGELHSKLGDLLFE